MPDAEQQFFEGNRHLADGDLAAAERSFREAIRLAPALAEAHANLAFVLDQRGDPQGAEAGYRQALALNPRQAQVRLNFGALLARLKRFAEAEAEYKSAVTLSPTPQFAWSNLGVLYACTKREAEAEQCYRTALALDPDYANARFNQAYLMLRQGRFDEGWACLEARDWYRALEARLPCTRWRGEPLAGKSLLIGFEAGHGDMIQFGRYAAVLKAQGATSISMICHPALKVLFETLNGVDEIISFDEPLPPAHWDFWTPPLSIPFHLRTRIDSIPARLPYLAATPERIAKWAPLLPPAGPRIGLVWKGSTSFENDADRSLPSLDILAPLGRVRGVSFVSLQKGAGEAEAANPPRALPLVDLGSRFEDFADAAAAIAGVDLVISVDTAMAHLAGAMAKPCWLLLPDYKPDWRWLAERRDSPWYPRVMRLFRQPAGAGWGPVIEEMATLLAATDYS